MTNWKLKVKGLRKLLTENNSDKNAIKTGKQIYKILTSKKYEKYFEDFYELDEFLFIENLEHFNDVLDRMYDYCDENLIWIELEK